MRQFGKWSRWTKSNRHLQRSCSFPSWLVEGSLESTKNPSPPCLCLKRVLSSEILRLLPLPFPASTGRERSYGSSLPPCSSWSFYGVEDCMVAVLCSGYIAPSTTSHPCCGNFSNSFLHLRVCKGSGTSRRDG